MKRTLSALLLIALLASVSCGGEAQPQNETTVSSDTTEPTEVTTARIEPDLPDKRWDGYEFRVLTKGDTNVHWKSKDIAASEENGDVINDAVFKRNLAVTDRFGVTFTDIASSSGTWNLSSPARTSIMAGADDFDMIAGAPSEVVKNLAPDGLLMDLSDIPYIDLEKPWYDQNSIEQMSIGGKVFCATGSMLIMDDDATLVVLFNKKLATDYKLPDLYELVDSGKWTIDVMNKYATDASADLNNDGVMGNEDQYGLTSEALNTYACMVASGVQLVTKKGDELTFNTSSERFVDAFNKSVKLNRDYDICIHSSKITGVSDSYVEVIDPAFIANRILFNMAGLVRVSHFRAMETDFGIIPMPKFDESQEEYYSMVSLPCSNTIIVPKTASDLERTGAIIEALSAEGHYTLRDAYYDNVLKAKGARDEESAAMLDLIFGNRVYDIGYMYDWGGLVNSINTLEIDGNIASTMDSNLSAAKTAMEKTLEAYEKLS